MSYVVVCQSCSKKNAVADDVFDRRILGRKVSLRCKGCQQAIVIDGTDPVQRAKLGVANVSGATQRPPVAPAAPVPAGPPLLPALRLPRQNVASKTLIGLAAPPLIVPPPKAAPPRPTVGEQKVDLTPAAVVMAPMDEPAGRISTSAVSRARRSRAASDDRWLAFSAVFALVGIAAVALAVKCDRAASATSERALEEPALAVADESEIPSTVDARTVLAQTAVALRRAERCDAFGRAVGSADVFVTFAPRGRVVAARLEGEPLARAPVASCILEHVRSVQIPAYEGEPFTLRQKITLR